MSRGAAVVQFRGKKHRRGGVETRVQVYDCDKSLVGKRRRHRAVAERVSNLNCITGVNRRSWKVSEGGIATDGQIPQLYCS